MIASAITQLIYMSKKTIIAATTALLAAAGIIALGSCSSNDEILDAQNRSYYPDDNIVRVEANVNNMTTRGSIGDASELKDMSLTIFNPQNSKYCYRNNKMTKQGDNWIPETLMLWENKDTHVGIVAFSPYQEIGDDRTLIDEAGFYRFAFFHTVDTVQTADNCRSDLLVYKNGDFNPGSQLTDRAAIPITFRHVMSQLVITVKFGTEFDTPNKLTKNPIENLKIGGTLITGYCDLISTPAVVYRNTSGTNRNPVDVTPYPTGDFVQATDGNGQGGGTNASQKYTCILVPQTIPLEIAGFNNPNLSISFTINGKKYRWVSPSSVTFESGKIHNLELTVGKDFVVAGSISATPWDTNTTEQNLNTD